MALTSTSIPKESPNHSCPSSSFFKWISFIYNQVPSQTAASVLGPVIAESIHDLLKRNFSDSHSPQSLLDMKPIGFQSQRFGGPFLSSAGTKGWGVQCGAQAPHTLRRGSGCLRSLGYPILQLEIMPLPLLPSRCGPFISLAVKRAV